MEKRKKEKKERERKGGKKGGNEGEREVGEGEHSFLLQIYLCGI